MFGTVDQWEQWSTIIANVLAILTVTFSVKPIWNWGRAVRNELVDMRRRLEFGAEPDFHELALSGCQVRLTLETPDESGRWLISWSRPNMDGSGRAEVTSPRLLGKLQRGADHLLDKPMNADIRLYRASRHETSDRELEIVRLNYVEGERFAKLAHDAGEFLRKVLPPWGTD